MNRFLQRGELTISTDGVASVTGFVRGKSEVTNTYVKATLQQKVSDSWVDVKFGEDSNSTRSTTVAETYELRRLFHVHAVTLQSETMYHRI